MSRLNLSIKNSGSHFVLAAALGCAGMLPVGCLAQEAPAAAPAPAPAPALAQEAPKPYPFEKSIEAFEAADKVKPPTKGGIVFVGSSSITRWKNLAQDFPEHNVINRGFGGSQLHQSVHYAHRIVTPYEPRLVVLFAGSNDIGARKTPEEVAAAFKEFVSKVREKLPATTIAYISITTSPSRRNQMEKVQKANALIAEYIKTDAKLKFVDVFPLMLDEKGEPRPELYVGDRLHMSPAGYDIWIKALKPVLAAP